MRPIICFDWDGTLADSMDLCVAEVREALRVLGLPDQPDEKLRQCNGPSYEETVSLLGVPVERAQEYYAARLSAEIALVPTVSRLFDGIRDLLEALKDRADICVVSNGLPDYLAASIRAFGLEGTFAQVVGWRLGRTKTENLRGLLAAHPGRRAIMVGDRLGDINAGKACGIPTIAAGFGYGNDAEYRQADLWVKSVAELKSALLDFCSGKAL